MEEAEKHACGALFTLALYCTSLEAAASASNTVAQSGKGSP
jgi:hypothetical protein